MVGARSAPTINSGEPPKQVVCVGFLDNSRSTGEITILLRDVFAVDDEVFAQGLLRSYISEILHLSQ
jgi:hypothetical protein